MYVKDIHILIGLLIIILIPVGTLLWAKCLYK